MSSLVAFSRIRNLISWRNPISCDNTDRKFFLSLPWDFLHCLIGIFIWKRLLGPLPTRVAVFFNVHSALVVHVWDLRKHKPIFVFYFISSLDIEEGAGSWNPSLWKTRGQLSYIVNNMTSDYLATQGFGASGNMILAFFLEYFALAWEWFINIWQKWAAGIW